MSEKLNTNSEKTPDTSSPYDTLSDMSGQFDPEQAMAARQQALNEQNRKEFEAVQSKLGGMPNGPAEEYGGETNTNGATGKERTYTQWDIHPKMQGETSRDFGDREIKRNDMAVLTEYIPRENDPNKTSAENIKAYSEKIEAFENKFARNEGESLDGYRRRIKGLFEQGALTLEDATAKGPAEASPSNPAEPSKAEANPTNPSSPETEKASVAEVEPSKNETNPGDSQAEQVATEDSFEDRFFNQYTEGNIGQIMPQVRQEVQPAQTEDTKKKPGLLGRIRGFFAKRREKRAEKKQQKGIARYEATHPDAVQDVEKARAMAEASNDLRQLASEARRNNDAHGVNFYENLANSQEELEGKIYDIDNNMNRYEAELKDQLGMTSPKSESASSLAPGAASFAEASKINYNDYNDIDASSYDITPPSISKESPSKPQTNPSQVRRPVARQARTAEVPKPSTPQAEVPKQESSLNTGSEEDYNYDDIDTSYIGTSEDPFFKKSTTPGQSEAQKRFANMSNEDLDKLFDKASRNYAQNYSQTTKADNERLKRELGLLGYDPDRRDSA